jgi:hypothetical protein
MAEREKCSTSCDVFHLAGPFVAHGVRGLSTDMSSPFSLRHPTIPCFWKALHMGSCISEISGPCEVGDRGQIGPTSQKRP